MGQTAQLSMPNWPQCSPPNKGDGGDIFPPPSVPYLVLQRAIRSTFLGKREFSGA
jgi:hypothetical protein